MTTITLGSIELAETASAGWMFNSLTDWWGQTDDKREVSERPQSHGAFDVSRSLRTSRAVSFNAVFLGSTEAAVETAVDDLAAQGAEGPVLMTVSTPAGVTWRRVSVQASAFTDHRGQSTGQVAVDCIARDPRRYADAAWIRTAPPTAGTGVGWPLVWPLIWPSAGSGGRIILTNSGRAPSAPTFRLLGGFATALITCAETGSRIGFDRAVPIGSTVEIDTANRRAVIDGQSDVSRWLRWREWETVPGLSSRSFQFDVTGATGTPFLDGRVFSAWW